MYIHNILNFPRYLRYDLLNVLAGLNSLFKVMVKYFLGEANFDQVLHIYTYYNSL